VSVIDVAEPSNPWSVSFDFTMAAPIEPERGFEVMEGLAEYAPGVSLCTSNGSITLTVEQSSALDEAASLAEITAALHPVTGQIMTTSHGAWVLCAGYGGSRA